MFELDYGFQLKAQRLGILKNTFSKAETKLFMLKFYAIFPGLLVLFV